ncbi:MAG: PspC domain-containing protein [Chitinophagia bacterium]|jgi:phage shock protein PspC (stress-responsive transcriptional regulator)
MKKVININFQGRVIPIEESAFELLKAYTDSLRRCFAQEEGKDEIINDIESRIAELFGEALKKGSVCITDDQVNAIIDNMGRPEDLEQGTSSIGAETNSGQKITGDNNSGERGKLYRDENDKIIGGVCSGIANYFKVDPSIIRVAFVLTTLGWGSGVLLYVILWAILPGSKVQTGTRNKRLFRNPDEKVVAGVASGIASYFDIAVWIPRLIFALPLITGLGASLINTVFNVWFWSDEPISHIVFSSFGGTLLIIYLVLWAIIPEAKSASEKLEMRGEKIDLNSIKTTIQEDLHAFAARAEKWGKEVNEKAQDFGKDVTHTVTSSAQNAGSAVVPVAKSGISRIGTAIGVVFKAFFMFIFGLIALVLLITLVAILFAGAAVFPLKNFLLEGFDQQFLGWLFLLLFFGTPIIALVTSLIRRAMGVKSGNKYIGYTFAGMWVIGLFSGLLLISSIKKDFSVRVRENQDSILAQPTSGKVFVRLKDANIVRQFGPGIHLSGLARLFKDSIQISNIDLRIEKSADSLYHLNSTRISSGKDDQKASANLAAMQFGFQQQDSVLILDRGIILPPGSRFRNQQIILTIQVPVGKKILVDRAVNRKFFFLNLSNINFADVDGGDDWELEESKENWRSGVEYVMTETGLKKTGVTIDEKNWSDNSDDEEHFSPDSRKSRRQLERELERKNRELEKIKKELDKPAESKKVAIQQPAKEGTSQVMLWLQSALHRITHVTEDKAVASAYIFYPKLI